MSGASAYLPRSKNVYWCLVMGFFELFAHTPAAIQIHFDSQFESTHALHWEQSLPVLLGLMYVCMYVSNGLTKYSRIYLTA